MKKILIIILVILILLLGGAWAYLLLNGSPANMAEVRNDLFGSGDSNTPTAIEQPVASTPVETSQATFGPISVTALLTQVTKRSVAGAVIASTTDGLVIRYMEKGTGHIYDVSLVDGTEIRVSNQTLPHVVDARWSDLGNRVVIITEIDGVLSAFQLGELSTSDNGSTVLTTENFTPAANVAFSKAGDTLYYSRVTPAGDLSAQARNLKTDTVTTLFTTPFTEAVILWDLWGGGEHLVYTKPATGYQGFLYAVTNGALKKYSEGSSLTALRTQNAQIENKNEGKGPYSFLVTDGLGIGLPIQTLREKCDGNYTTIWCGATTNAGTNDFPIRWYQGLISYADQLWKIDRATGKTTLVTDPEGVAREQLDVTDLMVGEGGHIIFKNKRDDSLWLYNPPR